ncbi:hypothetical protein TRSC58_03467 [Trypanosoma rangeli SC58]|uniref:Uncharacterized protein n=1 Tax=Trypanosoma rangeli SC58 TaxID=429131 RepID=A0A061J1L2_TRYRA|nr:hypothetical protein TRSC58_03467 [Trypanosoma rangeli SC58]
MSLGGRAVQAHSVTLHRAMPSKEKVARRRRLAYAHKTKGASLHTHDLRQKNPIAALVKYARVEKANNEHLQRLGIDYAYHGFEEQLEKVPSHLIIRKRRRPAKEPQGPHGDDNKNDKGKNNKVESTVVSSPLSSVATAVHTKGQKRTKKSVSDNDTAVPSPGSAIAAAPTRKHAKKPTAPTTKKRRVGAAASG